MNLKTYITIDISRTNIAVICTSHQMAQTNVLFKKVYEGKFTKNDKIINHETIVKHIDDAKTKLANILGYMPVHVNITLNNESIKIQKSTSSLRINNDNGAVSQLDIDNINQLASNVNLQDELTQIHAQPYRFILDDKTTIYKNPLHFEAEKLAVDMLIYSASSKIVRDIKAIMKHLNLKITLFTPSGIGLGHEAASIMELEKGVSVVDIGERETTINIFKKENLIATKVIKTGYYKIIKDIMTLLDVDVTTAKTFFNDIAPAMGETINEYKIYSKFNNRKNKVDNYTNKHIIEIANARMKSICALIEREVFEIIKPDSVSIILTGMLANFKGLDSAIAQIKQEEIMSVYVPKQIGAQDARATAALGNSYFIFINEDQRSEIAIPAPSKEFGGIKGMLRGLVKKSKRQTA